MLKMSNGKALSQESIIDMIKNCVDKNWEGSDLYPETEKVFERMLNGYDGLDEDISYIIDHLKADGTSEINLQDIESIIKDGEWNFNL